MAVRASDLCMENNRDGVYVEMAATDFPRGDSVLMRLISGAYVHKPMNKPIPPGKVNTV